MWVFCGLLVLSQVGCRKKQVSSTGPVTQPETEQYIAQEATTKDSEVAPDVNQAAVESPAPEVAAPTEITETAPETVAEQPAAPPVGDGPAIEMAKLAHDWGEIGPDTRQTTQFSFTNTGSTPLKITRVRKCCGTITRGVQDGQEYASGETGTLEVEYIAGSYPGSMRRNLHLETNVPGQKVITLTIKATIVQRVEHQPKRLRLFYKQENAGCGDITLKSLDGRPFSVTGFRATAASMTADFDPEAKAAEVIVRPKVDLEKLKRNPRGEIRISLTHPECRTIRILYDMVPEYTVSPPQLMLFNLKPGEPVKREVWILSNYADDFEIESVESEKGTARLVESKKVKGAAAAPRPGGGAQPGARYQLWVEITPPTLEGENNVMSDVLKVQIQGGDTLSIQCRGFY
jgi:hypothetical protein